MNGIHADPILHWLASNGTSFGLKVIAAIAAWLIGRRIIKFATALAERAMTRNDKIESTLSRYLLSIINVALTIALIILILDMFGVQTTSFAALLAGAGLAVGTAWGGLLSHFAAGVFMQVMRPFKVGDYVSVAGIEGTVRELGIVGTTLVSLDNVVHIIGNQKIFNDTIKNYSMLPYRRVDCEVRTANMAAALDAVKRLRSAIVRVKDVRAAPPPEIEIKQFAVEGPIVAVRAYCHNNHYTRVYFDINNMIAHEVGQVAYTISPPREMLRLSPKRS
jgi:small conductance mechanosensitive channel